MTSKRYTRVERGIMLDTTSGTYRASTTDTAGRDVYGSAKSLDTARSWLSAARAARAEGLAPPPSPLLDATSARTQALATAETFEGFWWDWHARKVNAALVGRHSPHGRRKEVVRPATLAGYALLMRCHILPALGSATLELPRDGGISKAVVVGMRDSLARRGLAKSTQREIIALVSRMLDEAGEEGHPVLNVARSVKSIEPLVPLKRSQTNLRPLCAEERLTLIRAIPHPVEAAGHLASWAGLRSAEVLGVQVGDFDLDSELHGHVGWLNLVRQRRWSGRDETVPWLKHRSEGETRLLPLAPSLVAYLRWYIGEMFPGFQPGDPRESEPLVRAVRRGNRWHDRSEPHWALSPQMWPVTLRAAVSRVPALRYEALGFDITPHNLREDLLSELKDAVSPYARSSYAGHRMVEHQRFTSGSKVTDDAMTYGKHFTKDLVPVALAIDELIERATGGRGLIHGVDRRLGRRELAEASGVDPSLIERLSKNGVLPFDVVTSVRNGHTTTRRVWDPVAVELVEKHLDEGITKGHSTSWSCKEAARLVGLHHQTLRRERGAGNVPSAFSVPATNNSGFLWRFPDEAIYEIAALNLRGSTPPPARHKWATVAGRHSRPDDPEAVRTIDTA